VVSLPDGRSACVVLRHHRHTIALLADRPIAATSGDFTRVVVRHDRLCGVAQNYGSCCSRDRCGYGEAGGTPPANPYSQTNSLQRSGHGTDYFALGACLGAWLGSSVAGDVAERAVASRVSGLGDRTHRRCDSPFDCPEPGAASWMKPRRSCPNDNCSLR